MSEYSDETYGEMIANPQWLEQWCESTGAGDAHPADWRWTCPGIGYRDWQSSTAAHTQRGENVWNQSPFTNNSSKHIIIYGRDWVQVE